MHGCPEHLVWNTRLNVGTCAVSERCRGASRAVIWTRLRSRYTHSQREIWLNAGSSRWPSLKRAPDVTDTLQLCANQRTEIAESGNRGGVMSVWFAVPRIWSNSWNYLISLFLRAQDVLMGKSLPLSLDIVGEISKYVHIHMQCVVQL